MVAVRIAVVILVTLLIQVSFVSPLSVGPGVGNIVLLFAIAAGLETDPERGAIAGFAAGLAFDLLLDTPAGLSALTLALVGYGVGLAKDYVIRSSWLITTGLVLVASAAGTLIYAAVAVVFGVTVDAGELPTIVAVIAVINALLSRPMRWAVRWAYGPDSDARSRDRLVFR